MAIRKDTSDCNSDGKSDKIEGMKVIKNLGYIEAKPSMLSFNTRKTSKNNLVKNAEELGANGIIKYKYEDALGLGFGVCASGDAVKVEEIR